MPFANSDGVRIYYEVEGTGFPVLLHTGGGGDADMWRQAGYVEGLRGYRCILMDHRGHGRSDRPKDLAAHTIECYAADALAVLNAAGADRAAFWGYSDGRNVGYALTEQHPERVAALIGTGTFGDPNFPEARARDVEVWRHALRHGSAGLNAVLEEEEGGAIPEWFQRQMAATDPDMFLLEIAGWASWSGPLPLLQRIRVPTLLLVGEREDPEQHTLRAARLSPNARCVTFPGLGHVAAFVRGDLALPHAREFLREATTAV